VSDKAGGKALQIIRNVLVNWFAYAVTIVIGFFMAPFLVHHLGDSVYGVWTLLGSLTGYLGLLDFGITPSVVKSVAAYRAKDDQNGINRIVTGGALVFVVIGAISMAISIGLAFVFNDLFPSPLSRSAAAEIVLLTGLNLAITFPASVFIGALRGFQRYDIDAAVSTVTLIARSVLIVVLLLNGQGIIALAIATFVFDMARLAYLLRAIYKINPGLKVAREFYDKAEMRHLFGQSSHFFLMAVGNRINYFTDSIVIGLYLSTAAITPYALALRLITYLRELVIEMTGVLMPAITHLHATEATDSVRELHVRATRYAALLTLPCGLLFWILGGDFLTLWVGPEYAESHYLLQILTFGIVLHLLATPTGSVLTGLGRHDIVARFSILQALTNLGVTLLLVKPLGLAGVALGTAVSMFCFVVWSLPVYFRHYLKQPLGSFLRRALLGPVLLQVPVAALLITIKTFVPPHSLALFFGQCGVLFAIYGALAYVLVLSPDEKRTFGGIVRRFARR
jgi:O-antigen/teichoic acid export membrane protein